MDKNNKNDIDILSDDEFQVEHNRINDIENSNGKKANMGMQKGVIILSSIALTAVIGIIIFIALFGKKTSLFTPTKKDNNSEINRILGNGSKDSKSEHIKKGIESYSRGYLNDAFSEFNEVVESDASDQDKAIALTYMGIISDDKGETGRALEFYSRALKYDKNNAEIYKNISLAYRHKKEYISAIENAKKSISLNPKDVNSLILLGNIYYDTNRYSDAIGKYNEALKISPGNTSVIFNLGSAHLKAGEEFAAIEYLKKAASLDRIGEIAQRAYTKLGVLYTERNRNDLAVKYLNEAVKIKPKNSINRYNLGIAYLKSGEKEKALQEFIKAEELEKNDLSVLENIGEAYLSLKDYNRGLNLYNKILEKKNRNVKILSKIGEIYYKKGDMDRAFKAYRKITIIEPLTENARIAYLNLGNILDDTNRPEEAIKNYKKALTISPKDHSAHYNIGIAYSHADKPELAIDSWRESSRLNPQSPSPLLAIADYYFKKNHYDLAEKEYEAIWKRWPNNQEPHFRMASIYDKRGDVDYAINALNRVLKINNKNEMARKSYVNLGRLMSQKGNDEESFKNAENYIKKALLLKPNAPEALLNLGNIYSKKMLYIRAIETYYQVIKASSNSKITALAYDNMGQCYYKQKKYKKSLRAFSRAVESDPTNESIRMNRKSAMKAYESQLSE